MWNMSEGIAGSVTASCSGCARSHVVKELWISRGRKLRSWCDECREADDWEPPCAICGGRGDRKPLKEWYGGSFSGLLSGLEEKVGFQLVSMWCSDCRKILAKGHGTGSAEVLQYNGGWHGDRV